MADDIFVWAKCRQLCLFQKPAGIFDRIYRTGHGFYHRMGQLDWSGGYDYCADCCSAIIMQDIIPGTPTWLWIVVFSLLLFGVNFFNAKAFGNISFWVSSLKMILVVVFIIIGIAMMLGVTGGGP